MLRQFFMWALICATASVVCSQNHGGMTLADCDTTEYPVSQLLLNEVVVTASPVVNKSDRRIIRLDEETRRISTDAVDLLRRLNLPRITINPLTNAISVSGGGEVIICIDGVESTAAQIAAVRPQDIVRVEYHDNPGVRYAGAEAVIDYITVRHRDGGNLSFDTFGAFERGRWAMIDHLTGQYNRGRSVWSVSAGYMGQHKDQWVRDYDEVWHYSAAAISRHESGLPVSVGQSGLESCVNYNYQHPSGNVFNMRLGFDLNDVPNQEEGDRQALLYTSDTEIPELVSEHTEEHSQSPNIGLYYRCRLSENRNLVFDVQGTYMHTRMLHEYSEKNHTEINRVAGDKYSMKFLGMYETRNGGCAWNIGASGNASVIDNTYYQDAPEEIRSKRSETTLFGEYSNRVGNWSFLGNVRTAYRHMEQQNTNIDKIFVLPSASISYRPSDKWFMRYAASLDYIMPSAAEVTNIVQPIQMGMVRRGNPVLQPFRVINQSFDASFDTDIVNINARLEYRNEHNPIMESVIFEDGRFVRTYLNQRSFQRLMAVGSVSFHLWKNHLTIAAEPTLTRYFSHGIDYHHCHNIFRLGLSLDFKYGSWLAYANVMSGPANNMYGEEIIEEKDMNQIMAGYKHGSWSLHVGVFNAFMKNYWMETRNLSALTPYTSKAHSARSSSYLAVRFNIAIDFGRGSRNVEIMEKEADNDNGILIGTK